MEKMEQRDIERIEAVLKILKKQAPLSLKQEKYCNDSCVERFLKGKGDNAKKAAKHLRAVLSWRESIGTDLLIADEFSSELADGVAYVAGHDDEARPVMVFRIKQEYLKSQSQKSYLRLLVFTLEVAISTMSRFVDQFVILFDASFFRSAPTLLHLYMMTLKVIADYYPGRLHKAFVVDPPSIFSCIWKGARPFVEQWTATTVASSISVHVEESQPKDRDRYNYKGEEDVGSFSSYPQRTASLRFEPSPNVSARSNGGGGSTSSRFAFTVSHLDSLKPWYLSSVGPAPTTTAVLPKPSHVVPTSPSLLAGGKGRSFSFASPASRSTPAKSPRQQQQPRTPMPSFLQSPFSFGRKKKEKVMKDDNINNYREQSSFKLYLRFYGRPYDEMMYRSTMRPPLGGLLSIVSPQLLKQRRQLLHCRQGRRV